jgi:hypothetical protein
MADTPDLGAAEESFNEAEAGYTEAETNFNAAKEAFESAEDGAENYEELQAAFSEHETLFKTAAEKRDAAKSAVEELKKTVNKGYWPEDWRERYVDKLKDKDGKPLDDDSKEKMMKRLSRYSSPRAAMDAMINAQNKIASGKLIKMPGKDATPEEIAEYRKEAGIPEDAKGYDLSLSDGLVVGEEDKEMVDSFLSVAHDKNFTQDQVSAGLNWFYQNQEAELAKRHEADMAHRAAVEEELRAEWGQEYQANRNLMANYFDSDFEEGVADLIVGARLADGTPLANHPDIVRGFVAKARAANPMAALVPGSGTKQHDQMIAEIEALEKKMGTEGALKGRDQDRYLKLISLRDKIPEK